MFLVPDFVVYLSLVMLFCRGRVEDLSSVEEEFGNSRHVSQEVKGVLVVCLVALAFEEKLLGILYGGLRKAVGLWGVGRAECMQNVSNSARNWGPPSLRIVSGQPRVLNHLAKVFVTAAVFVLLSLSVHRYPEWWSTMTRKFLLST